MGSTHSGNGDRLVAGTSRSSRVAMRGGRADRRARFSSRTSVAGSPEVGRPRHAVPEVSASMARTNTGFTYFSGVTHLLTVSGSLRRGSSNSTLLAAVARLVPAGVTVSDYGALA